MAKKTRSPGDAIRYTRYTNEDRFAKNKLAKLNRHLRLHPADSQARTASLNPNFPYTRNMSGHSKKFKDSKDKFRFGKYIWNKAYPPAKKVRQGIQLRAGYTISEQLL